MGLLAGNTSMRRRWVADHAGAALKLHEDWADPGAIDTCLRVADQMDVQVAIIPTR